MKPSHVSTVLALTAVIVVGLPVSLRMCATPGHAPDVLIPRVSPVENLPHLPDSDTWRARRQQLRDLPIKQLMEAAEAGDAAAMTELARRYEPDLDAHESMADDARAVAWLRRAAAAGEPSAMVHLGVKYKRGEGVEKNPRLAVQWYAAAAEKGNASGMVNLGNAYLNGDLGLEQDETEAARLFRAAADQDHRSGLNGLALLYLFGRGVAKDEAEAARLLRAAAEQGHPTALANLGVLHLRGVGVERDAMKAVELLVEAAEAGHGGAVKQMRGAVETLAGEGSEPARQLATQWLEKHDER